jgi:predicted PurR-regulated permease PerM
MISTFGDSGSAVVIIIIFSLVHILLAVSIGITNIRNNWDKYKCDPAIIPFAGTFGHNVSENFNQCIKTTQVDFMGPFLEPVYQSLTYFSQNGAAFTDMFEDLKVFGNEQDNEMSNFAEDAKNRLYRMGDSSNKIFISVVDTFSKLASTITILFYTLKSGLVIGENAWNELPGTFIKIATFGSVG